MTIYLNVMYILIVFFILLYPGYSLTTEVYKLASGGDKPDTAIRIKGCIPILNNFTIQKLLYGGSKGILKAYIALVPIIVLRVVALITKTTMLLQITALFDIVGILICWALAAYVAIDIGRMVDAGGAKLVACIIVPPLGCYLVARTIGPYLKHSNDEVEDTFLDNE